METVLLPEREASITAVDAPADAAGAGPGRSAARPPGEGPPRGPAPTARVELTQLASGLLASVS
jgi:hypothetical protein